MAWNMTRLVSSNVVAVGWDDEEGLRVQFKDGQSYVYPPPPQGNADRRLYEGLLSAPSPGSWFYSNIRGRILGQRE